MDLFDVLKGFQIAIVGFIGFSGVIIAQFVIASLSRRQVDRNLEQKRSALKISLLAELRFFKGKLERGLSDTPPLSDEEGVVGRYKREFSVALASDLGLLERDLSEAVLLGLMVIDEVDLKLGIVAKKTTGEHFVFSAKNWKIRTAVLEGAIGPIESAIEAIESSLGPRSAKT